MGERRGAMIHGERLRFGMLDRRLYVELHDGLGRSYRVMDNIDVESMDGHCWVEVPANWRLDVSVKDSDGGNMMVTFETGHKDGG